MEILIISGAFQAIFFFILVISKKRKTISDIILAFWLFVFSAHLAFVYYAFKSGYVFYTEYGYIPSGILIVCYSLMYVYTQALVSKKNTFNKKWLYHLIPIGLFYISIIPLAKQTYEEKAYSITHPTSDYYQLFVFGVLILFVIGYIVAILRLLKQHKVSIRKMFSYEENIDLNWLKLLTFMLIVLWIVLSGFIAFFYYQDMTNSVITPKDQMVLDMQGQITFVIFVFLLGFFGIKQQVIYTVTAKKKNIQPSTNDIVVSDSRYKKSGLKKADSAEYLKELLQYMDNEKPYLNGKLSLKEVADKLNISTNHLSQVINENLDKNFFDFVNNYRVDLVKQKMSDPANKNYTILALAYDCGFNSKSSFNAIFKKQTGLTPSQFLKNK